MPADVPGLHHVTAIASDPDENLAFYTDTLGLRLVKRSINQDDADVYHLFYGDREGSPGTSMTFFPYPDVRPGSVGRGHATAVAFLVPGDAVDYWVHRLDDAGVDVATVERFGDTVVTFEDPDGLPLQLVAREDAPAGNPPEGPVPPERAIRGLFGVTLSLHAADPTATLLRTMGYREGASDHGLTRYEAGGDRGYVVDLRADPQAPRARPGAGTVHHVAFRTTTEDHEDWRDVLFEQDLRPTEVIDRKWFESVYVRETGGVLFEFATEEPGYTVDEDVDELGEGLMLPEWLEDSRESIEAGLPELAIDREE